MSDDLDAKVIDCLCNSLVGDVGRQQYEYDSRVYCLDLDCYCPYKSESPAGLSYCNVVERREKHNSD